MCFLIFAPFLAKGQSWFSRGLRHALTSFLELIVLLIAKAPLSHSSSLCSNSWALIAASETLDVPLPRLLFAFVSLQLKSWPITPLRSATDCPFEAVISDHHITAHSAVYASITPGFRRSIISNSSGFLVHGRAQWPEGGVTEDGPNSTLVGHLGLIPCWVSKLSASHR